MFKAVKAIMRSKDSFFLQLRDNNNSIPYPNQWAFFGGRLHINENPKTGLIREIKEELSFQLEKPQEFYRWYNCETDTKIIYFMVEMSKKESFSKPNEGQKGNWFSKADLNLISIAPDIRAVKYLL